MVVERTEKKRNDRPVIRGVRQGPQPLRHPDFGRVAAMGRAMEDPIDHGKACFRAARPLQGQKTAESSGSIESEIGPRALTDKQERSEGVIFSQKDDVTRWKRGDSLVFEGTWTGLRQGWAM